MLRAPLLLLLAALAAPATARQDAPAGPSFDVETTTLPNGMTVLYHEDHSLPKVVINTWFAVGSKDEAPGRTGFAHLFEHLMFMGTGRVPDNQFDVLMEAGGGSNNATTSNDRTNYYSEGPSSLLPTLLWLDADRLEALADHMTQQKLDLQREVVRNERRQTSENTPYGKAWLLLGGLLHPKGHPYHHPVIGSHEDLEAATVQDVVDFFRTWYVPGNATLVIVGDFDTAEVKPIVERTFGAIPARPVPAHRTAEPVVLDREIRAVDTDRVSFAKLFLVWPSPAHYAPGDAELDLAAGVLAGGPSTRLERRLVQELGIAQEVDAYQVSRGLGSQFHVEALAAPGADLETIKREILAVLDELGRDGPTADELARVQAATESGFLRRAEDLGRRADMFNAYRHHLGTANGFRIDLARYTDATVENVRATVASVFGPGRVDLRILPQDAAVAGASLDDRPDDFPSAPFAPPGATSFALSNGAAVHLLPRPGAGLVSGTLHVDGGASLVGADRAGLAALAARMLNSGAGGKDTADFAAAVEALGGDLSARAGRTQLTVNVSGLASRLDATLDLFGDLVRRPNLAAADFEREKALQLAAVAARSDSPRALASRVARTVIFGADDARGRPLDGDRRTVEPLTLADVEAALPRLLDPNRATFVFAGDVTVEELRTALEARFGDWTGEATPSAGVRAVEAAAREDGPRLLLVHRDDAPQTVITIMRPIDDATGPERMARLCVDTVFGGSFTSRLNSNLREKHGYSYGAFSRLTEGDGQPLLFAGSSVRTDVTGPSLTEFHREFARMNADGITAAELEKARETLRRRLVESAETTSSAARTLAGLVADGRPLDAVTRDLAALDAVTLEMANRHATSELYAFENLVIALVGDADAILPQLADAGIPTPLRLDPEASAGN
jgi:predicted Zn-dependent peptidase